MINLPAAFTERMKQMLGREYDAFIASYDKERSQGLRVNGLKTDPAEFAKTAPFSLNPVAWAAESWDSWSFDIWKCGKIRRFRGWKCRGI